MRNLVSLAVDSQHDADTVRIEHIGSGRMERPRPGPRGPRVRLRPVEVDLGMSPKSGRGFPLRMLPPGNCGGSCGAEAGHVDRNEYIPSVG